MKIQLIGETNKIIWANPKQEQASKSCHCSMELPTSQGGKAISNTFVFIL